MKDQAGGGDIADRGTEGSSSLGYVATGPMQGKEDAETASCHARVMAQTPSLLEECADRRNSHGSNSISLVPKDRNQSVLGEDHRLTIQKSNEQLLASIEDEQIAEAVLSQVADSAAVCSKRIRRCPHLKKIVVVSKVGKAAQSMYLKKPGCHSCKSLSKVTPNSVAAGIAGLVLRDVSQSSSIPNNGTSATDLQQAKSSLVTTDSPPPHELSIEADGSVASHTTSPAVDTSGCQLWICLCCAKLSCGSETNDHVRVHALKRQHHLVMNIDSFDCWCYACSCDIVGEQGNNKIILESRRILEKHHRPLRGASLETSVAQSPSFSSTPVAIPGSASSSSSSKKARVTLPRNPGLVNIGNTCFFNSMMQSLAYTQHIYKFIPVKESHEATYQMMPYDGTHLTPESTNITLNLPVQELSQSTSKAYDSRSPTEGILSPTRETSPASCNTHATVSSLQNTDSRLVLNSSKTPLTNELFRFLRTMRQRLLSDTVQSINPRSLFSEVSRQWESYSSYRQQDSHELLRRLLDGVKEEQSEKDGNGRVISLQQETFVDDVFGGQMASIIICRTCNHPIERRSSMRDILSTLMRSRSRLKSPASSKRELIPPLTLKLGNSSSSNGSDDDHGEKPFSLDSSNRGILSMRLERLRLSPRRALSSTSSTSSTLPTIVSPTSPNLKSTHPFPLPVIHDDAILPGSEGNLSLTRVASESGGSPPSSPLLKSEFLLRQSKESATPRHSVHSETQRLADIQALLKTLDPIDLEVNLDRNKGKSVSGGASLSVARCLTNFMSVETLEGDNAIHCDNCYKLKYGEDEQVKPLQSLADVGSQLAPMVTVSEFLTATLAHDEKTSPLNTAAKTPPQLTDTLSVLPIHHDLYANTHTARSPDRCGGISPASALERSPRDTLEEAGIPLHVLNTDLTNGGTLSEATQQTRSSTLPDMADNGGKPFIITDVVEDLSEGELSGVSQSDSDTEIQDMSLAIPVEVPKPVSSKAASPVKTHPPCVSDAYKRFLLFSAPLTLVLHLKRFEQEGSTARTRKVDAFVPFEEWLDLGSVMTPSIVCEPSLTTVSPVPSTTSSPSFKLNGVGHAAQFQSQSFSAEEGKIIAPIAVRFMPSLSDLKSLSPHSSPQEAVKLPPSTSTTPTLYPPTQSADRVPIRRHGGKYRLYAVVVHSGSIFGGHYVAYVRVPPTQRLAEFGIKGTSMDMGTEEDMWTFCSDSTVRVATLDEVLKCQAYILFYERTNLK
ncbi:hypothetical protein BASA61_002463 [Batrachochytrium salamandrivorans]|nr:hypothetical protein BASA61_002463 [Batrachochytrium salamandrivorans]